MNRFGHVLCFLVIFTVGGCKKDSAPVPRGDKLVILTPHNEDIKYEFDKAFRTAYLKHFGKSIDIEWRDIGSGSSAMLSYLQNVYLKSETSGIDVLFGGGEYLFQTLAQQTLLEKMPLSPEILENIPAEFCGMPLYDKEFRWCGSVLSSFGFLYNKEILDRLNLKYPQTWDDLGKPEFFNLVMLADPSQSGSVAAAYEMIVQSAPDWPMGWKRLLLILSNAAGIADSSGAAANAPLIGQAPVGICIDFIGALRAAKYPDKIGYVSPVGQTAYTPDPIGILKNPPNPSAAQAFVNFVLSLEGQALWAMPPGSPTGPMQKTLGRTPIRQDFYHQFSIPSWLPEPYQQGAEMKIDPLLRQTRYGVLILLVQSAAIDNLTVLKKAKQRLIETHFEHPQAELFFKLPENVDTIDKLTQISRLIKDKATAEKISAEWTSSFRRQFLQVQRPSQ